MKETKEKLLCSNNCEENFDEEFLPSFNERWEKIEWYYDETLDEEFPVVEVKIPDNNVEIVAMWSNFSQNCLSRSDYYYIDRTLYYDCVEDLFYAVEDSYKNHPVFACSVRSLSFCERDDFDEKSCEIENKELFNKI